MSRADEVPQALRTRLTHAAVEVRLASVGELARLSKETPAPPFDEILELLRERAQDDDGDVRTAAYEAKRPVAIERGKRQGLRRRLPAAAEMATLEDRPLVWKAIEIVWDAVSIYDGPEVLDASLRLATPGQAALYAVWWTESEVCNGGFSQYLYNPTGVLVGRARDGFQYIGASDLAAVVERAMRQFPRGCPPLEHGARQRALQKLGPNPFEGLDEQFYKHTSNLFPVAAKCVRDDLAEFFVVA
jgi:hypothetical protein